MYDQFREEDLIKRTHEYWEKRSRGFGYDDYIEALLGPELTI